MDTPTTEQPSILTDEFIEESSAPMPTVRVEAVMKEHHCANPSCKAPLNPGKEGRECPACRVTRA